MVEMSPARPAQCSPISAWRAAIIDSGLDPRCGIVPLASRLFDDDAGQVREGLPSGDPTGHGTAVAEIIQTTAQMSPGLLIAQVMGDSSGTTPAVVAAALYWALERGATLIHLSLGLASDRVVLASAVAAAVEAGVLVIASTPARGVVSFPARYAGVLRATGDARCRAGEISVLDPANLTFGGCVEFTTPAGRLIRGASIGAAYVTSFIVSRFDSGVSTASLSAQLSSLASYHGRERKRSPIPERALPIIRSQ